MLLVPSSLQNSSLPATAKRCLQSIQHRLSDDYIGVDGINLSGMKGDEYFGILYPEGLILLSFKDPSFLSSTIAVGLLKQVYELAVKNFSSRLHSHSSLKSAEGKLLFPAAVLYVFPDTSTDEIPQEVLSNGFVNEHCRFKEWLNNLRIPTQTSDLLKAVLLSPIEAPTSNPCPIDSALRDVIINRIAPWATIPKITQAEIDRSVKLAKSLTNLSDVSLPHDDSLVDVLRLDKKQVDEVNAIKKGHQLILACAGSGKSVLLIAKCFKLASLDKNRRFIILCYNKNLRDYYRWQIDEAGFSDRNVECLTVHQLFSKLIDKYSIPRPISHSSDDAYYDEVVERIIFAIKAGTIPPMYYGVFIDEVQIFKPQWYRACCMLLENPESNEHVLAICGDLTQNLRKSVKHGAAPWQGDNLPVFRGHTIHIETNYRNSVQINDFVNIYAGLVKARMPLNMPVSIDTYLRGRAYRMGSAPIVAFFSSKHPSDEAEQIIKAVRYMHDVQNIGYSEIAILIYNQSGNSKLGYKYPLLAKIKSQFYTNATDIQFVLLSWLSSDRERKPYSLRDGVSILTYEGALGIDFRGIVVGGISLIGTFDGVQYDTPETIAEKPSELANYRMGFDALYLACTRAKDSLAVVLPSKSSPIGTIYSEIMHECIAQYQREKGEVLIL